MPSYLDLGVIGIVLISAILSMMRGFTREALAIGSWAAAAAAAFYFYQPVTPYVLPYIHKDNIAQAVAAAGVFFATLIVASLITSRLSDWILDSRIGAADRSVGFLFGAGRGFLLAVVAFSLFNWLVADAQQPAWIKTAKTRPFLKDTAEWIIAKLPADAAAQIEGMMKPKSAAPSEEPPDETKTAPKAEAEKADAAPAAADKKAESAINKAVQPPAPPAPAVVNPKKP